MALIGCIKAIIWLIQEEKSGFFYLDMWTIKTDMSDGDTPEIREA